MLDMKAAMILFELSSPKWTEAEKVEAIRKLTKLPFVNSYMTALDKADYLAIIKWLFPVVCHRELPDAVPYEIYTGCTKAALCVFIKILVSMIDE